LLQFKWALPSDARVSSFGNFKYWALIRNGTKELVALREVFSIYEITVLKNWRNRF
jgi:hypothetical protein